MFNTLKRIYRLSNYRRANEIKNDLEKYGDKITEEEKTKITDSMTALTDAVKGDDVEIIRTKLSDLMGNSNPLTVAKQKAETPATTTDESKGDDSVVDVEATEVK
jgi:molecular chaperone DnaK